MSNSSSSRTGRRGPYSRDMKAMYKKILRDVLELNPMEEKYNDIPLRFPDASGTYVLTGLRLKLLRTISLPLKIVCDMFAATPDVKIKIIILRAWIRKHYRFDQDGRSQKSFWGDIDKEFESKKIEFGGDFRTVEWQRFLERALYDDVHTTPSPPPVDNRPLFTYQPFVMTLTHILN